MSAVMFAERVTGEVLDLVAASGDEAAFAKTVRILIEFRTLAERLDESLRKDNA